MVLLTKPYWPIPADELRKKFGKPNEFADYIIGVSEYGDQNPCSGIYTIRHGKKGRIVERKNFYYPTQTYGPAAVAAREKFATAIANWQMSSDAVKNYWRWKAKKLPMTGFNLFIKTVMLSQAKGRTSLNEKTKG